MEARARVATILSRKQVEAEIKAYQDPENRRTGSGAAGGWGDFLQLQDQVMLHNGESLQLIGGIKSIGEEMQVIREKRVTSHTALCVFGLSRTGKLECAGLGLTNAG